MGSRYSRRARKRTIVLAICSEEEEHARLRCARTLPRRLVSVRVIWKGTAPARSLSPSVQGRAPTC